MHGKDNRGRRRPFGGRKSERRDQTSSSNGSGEGSGFSREGKTKGDFRFRKQGERPSYTKTTMAEKPSWVAPPENTKPLPALSCIRCGLPITDSHSALSDRNGEPVHFDCVMAELSVEEKLETGDVLSYIGGGRFGVIHFNDDRGEQKKFSIKKIIEWEDKEKRAEWRNIIAEHYSIT